MTSPLPCPPGRVCPSSGLEFASPCPANSFAPSAGSAACTFCPEGYTSHSSAVSCEKCVPSAFDPKTFSCYTPLQQGWIIFGYVVSALSSLFSLYKLRVFVQERIQKLKEAGINPTLKGIVYLDRTLANHSGHLHVSMQEQPFDGTRYGSEKQKLVVELVRRVEQQLLDQQQQHQEQIQQLEQQVKSLQQ